MRLLLSFIAATGLLGCSRQEEITLPGNSAGLHGHVVFTERDTLPLSSGKLILVDASRDGGVWWFPQSPLTGFSATAPHQGKALADSLRAAGYRVHELTRNQPVTDDLLSRCTNVIRAGGFGQYSQQELAAYRRFLDRPTSLLLLQDHMQHNSNDQLSQLLGAHFEGSISGPLSSFHPHAVTSGTGSLPYIAGSYIRNADPAVITTLGYFTLNLNGTTFTAAAMGIIHQPNSRVFFMGDINGLESVPAPFTTQLFRWLLR